MRLDWDESARPSSRKPRVHCCIAKTPEAEGMTRRGLPAGWFGREDRLRAEIGINIYSLRYQAERSAWTSR
jgi:hypothetical protein